jgi:L,D-transpeptidase YbiS
MHNGDERSIRIHLTTQRLELVVDGRVSATYPVSTARRGGGEELGSEKTPRGRHEVCALIGSGAPRGAVFVGREWSGEICSADVRAAEPERDWILSRIIWLGGLEEGRNRGGSVDTFARYIYIHGTPDDEPLDEPRSHGCIRMRNDDVIALFAELEPGMLVEIDELTRR